MAGNGGTALLDRTSMNARSVLRLAVVAGLFAGFAEVLLLGVKKFALGQFIRFGPDVVWMAPLANAAIALVVAGLLLAGARRWPLLAATATAAPVFLFLGLLGALQMYYPLHVAARILLAAGAAVQARRILTRWPILVDIVERWVRRILPWGVTLVALLAAGVQSWNLLAFRKDIGQLPPAAGGVPNVVLIVLDTVRAANLSLYGYSRATTPHLDRWAQQGVVFERAVATAPWTLPSHASMFTGRWAHELSTDLEQPLDGRDLTLAEALRDLGYVTGGFVANTFYGGEEFGLARGFAHYESYVPSAGEFLISASLGRSVANHQWTRRLFGYYDNIPRRDAGELTSQFLDWLPRVQHRPFFAFLNYFDAHEAYLPPEPFATRFGPALPRGNERLIQDLRRSLRHDWHLRPASEIQTEIDSYDGAIAYLDEQLHRLFSALDAQRLLNRTLVIVTSDHGELFGEHGLFLHGQSLYEPLLTVPLVMSYPDRLPGGQRIRARVSLRDLPATVLDVIGVGQRTLFPGQSLAPYWSAAPVAERASEAVLSEVRRADWGKDWYPMVKGDMHSLMTDQHHYIRNGDGREELYALDVDPAETRDISTTEAGQILVQRFRTQLQAMLRTGRRDE